MYLTDTHVLLWWLMDDPSLSDYQREAIKNPDNEIYYSAVSIWEIAIKYKLNKIDLPKGFFDTVRNQALMELPISSIHAEETIRLPEIHKDPFDRLLIAQARLEKMTLITLDRQIRQYRVEVL